MSYIPVNIQKCNFKNAFHFMCELPSEILGCPCFLNMNLSVHKELEVN